MEQRLKSPHGILRHMEAYLVGHILATKLLQNTVIIIIYLPDM
jgi:hypothetical protein